MIMPMKDFLFTAVFRRRMTTERATDALRGRLAAAGIGGNMALCDARDLRQVLSEGAALAGYERRMLTRGSAR
jgi:hypothetical protein